jgi:hypothetical protein
VLNKDNDELIRNYGSDISVRKIMLQRHLDLSVGVGSARFYVEYRVYRGSFPLLTFANADEADAAATRLVRDSLLN